MKVVNFKYNLPAFGSRNDYHNSVKTADPHEIFSLQRESKGVFMLHMKCCCSDPSCKNGIDYYYSGLNYYFGQKNLGSDTEVNIHPHDNEKGETANNVYWNPTEENVAEFTSFAETIREAIAFKKELLRGLYARLQVKINGYTDIEILVRKEEAEIRFILFEITNILPKVPLLYESKTYRECLGVIATLLSDTDTSEIKNDYADMKNPFFEPIITWVKSLGEENKIDLEKISRIWVMPE